MALDSRVITRVFFKSSSPWLIVQPLSNVPESVPYPYRASKRRAWISFGIRAEQRRFRPNEPYTLHDKCSLPNPPRSPAPQPNQSLLAAWLGHAYPRPEPNKDRNQTHPQLFRA